MASDLMSGGEFLRKELIGIFHFEHYPEFLQHNLENALFY